MILYHPHSEGARNIEEYADDLRARHSVRVQLLSLETKDGADTASLYDIIQYPAILVTDDIGHPIKDWQGEQLPLKDEILGYASA